LSLNDLLQEDFIALVSEEIGDVSSNYVIKEANGLTGRVSGYTINLDEAVRLDFSTGYGIGAYLIIYCSDLPRSKL